MKRFLFSILAAVCALALLAGCGGKATPPDDTPPDVTPPVEETVTVTFVQAGQEDVTREVKKGGTLTDVPAPAPRTGYTVAWDRTDFSALSEDITVNAVETANRYTVSLDAAGGTVEPQTLQVTYDAEYTLPEPSREEFTFTAWMRGGTAIAVTGTWKIAEDVSLTAAWTPIEVETVTVTFVQTGYENVTREVKKGAALDGEDIPSPHAKTGYTVVWDTTDFSSVTENMTVTAVETPNEYTVTYDLNGVDGQIESETMTVTYDAAYQLYTPAAEGQIFLYWVVDGTGEKFTDGVWNRTESITLRAVWKLDEQDWTQFH